MQAGAERDNQVARIVYNNICAKYEWKDPKSQWDIPSKVVENNRAMILWDFKFQTHKQLLAAKPDMVVDKKQKTAVVIDVAIPADSIIRVKEYAKIEKYRS